MVLFEWFGSDYSDGLTVYSACSNLLAVEETNLLALKVAEDSSTKSAASRSFHKTYNL